MDNLIYLSVIFLSAIGFAIAAHIYSEKKSAKPMVCPMNFKCEQVLFSSYSKFLGVSMDIWGMLYYATSFVGYTIVLFWPSLATPQFIVALFFISGSAFLFSIYLTLTQLIKIGEWCSWCLGSAWISTLIFIAVSQTSTILHAISLIPVQITALATLAHAIIIILGVCVATISEFLFLRYINDRRISDEESRVLQTVDQIMLIIIGAVVVSKYLVYLSSNALFVGSSKFLVENIIIIAIILATLLKNFLVSSKLLGEKIDRGTRDFRLVKLLRSGLPLILGPITLVSWYSIFALETITNYNLSVAQYLTFYVCFLILGIVLGYLTPRTLSANLRNES